MRKIIFFTQVIAFALGNTKLHLNKLSTEFADKTGGKCLDGTPAAYYYAEGSVDKAIVFLQGGGQCIGYGNQTFGGSTDCDHRKKSSLGTSNGISETVSSKVLDSDPFKDWHKVYVHYCSGDDWTGVRTQPDDHDTYFSGGLILKAVYRHLYQNHPVKQVTEIVQSGSSAGAVGALMNLPDIKLFLDSHFNDQNIEYKLTGLAYSGFFPAWSIEDADGTRDFIDVWWQSYMLYSNGGTEDNELIKRCKAQEEHVMGCTWAEVYLKYIDSDFFMVQESFDSHSIFAIHGDEHDKPDGLVYAEGIMLKTDDAIQTFNTTQAYFVTSCMGHTFAAGRDMSDISIDGTTLEEAWKQWYYEDKSVTMIEQCDSYWPPCNALYQKGYCGWPYGDNEEFKLFLH